MKRTISVVGSATVSVEPDCARLTCGVQVTGVNAQDALARANQSITLILAALRDNGVAASDMRTNGPHLYPSERGYNGSNDITVVVRELSSVGSVIDAVAAAAGPNLTIHGVAFSATDPAPHLREARAAAVGAAKAIADELAAASGAAVGEALTINESSGYQAPVMVARDMKMASTPVAAGNQELRVDVTITYRLISPA